MLIKNLTITDLRHHTLLDHFSFTLGSCDKVGIIGEEGNGKSTLLKAIYQPSLIEHYTDMSGSIDTQNQTFGYFAQQMESQWDSVFVWEYLLKKSIHDEITDYNELSVYERECIRYHIDPKWVTANQTMASLSGGENVKIRLLKLLHASWDVLLLDEPTNDLDILTLQWLETFLKELLKPVMFISHDETLLQNCANVIIHLEQRNKKTKCVQTVYRGNYDDYVHLRSRRLDKEKQLAHKEQQEYRKKKQKLNDIQNAVHDALNDCVRNPSQAAKLAKKMRNIKAREAIMEREGYRKTDTVEEAVHIGFPGVFLDPHKQIVCMCDEEIRVDDKILIDHVSFSVRGQEKVVFVGSNGCGKTLLIKRIYECLKERTDIRLGYMPQDYQDEFHDFTTPIDFLLTSGDREDITKSRELLGCMKFTAEEMERSLREISEGMKAKLYIAKFIKQRCDVLLLDEPTRNLSPLTNPVLRHILKQYDGCIISVSHDRRYIEEVCDKRFMIDKGKIVCR